MLIFFFNKIILKKFKKKKNELIAPCRIKFFKKKKQ
jgi:hypothetical protein